MPSWTDVITSTSTGTGTTLTTLNGGVDYTVSQKAGNFVEMAPCQAATAAYTAAETSLQKFSVTSNSIAALQPKRVVLSPSHGGLGTFAGVQVPVVRSFPVNVPLTYSNIPLTFQGQSYVANTAAFRVGATITLATEPPTQKQVFWQTTDATTSSGTAAGAVSLPNIVINGGTRLTNAYSTFGVGTVTASESYIKFVTVTSADLSPIQTIRAYSQPVGAGLGTAVQVLQPDEKYWPQGMGLAPTATLTATSTQDEAVTVANNVVWGVGFER